MDAPMSHVPGKGGHNWALPAQMQSPEERAARVALAEVEAKMAELATYREALLARVLQFQNARGAPPGPTVKGGGRGGGRGGGGRGGKGHSKGKRGKGTGGRGYTGDDEEFRPRRKNISPEALAAALTCNVCGQRFDYVALLDVHHMTTGHGRGANGFYHCNSCGGVYDDLRDLRRHCRESGHTHSHTQA